jgi:hypothetical protein
MYEKDSIKEIVRSLYYMFFILTSHMNADLVNQYFNRVYPNQSIFIIIYIYFQLIILYT